jgi:CRISPR-associated endonuclease Csy4
MNYYIEITLVPDSEMPLNRLFNVMYTKLHKALCDLHSTNIGVSFPKYQINSGNVLRIHGEALMLSNLQGLNWIGGMRGYCTISDITPIPTGTKFRTVSRIQPTMSPAKMRRLVKRGSLKQEEAKDYKSRMFASGLNNPYLELISSSNGNKHRRYIKFGTVQDMATEGGFDQFGLSNRSTIPWF